MLYEPIWYGDFGERRVGVHPRRLVVFFTTILRGWCCQRLGGADFMETIIHRGTGNVGGKSVEFRSGKSCIFMDFALPFIGGDTGRFDPESIKGKTVEELVHEGILPEVTGLYKNEEKAVDGILFSHFDLDRYGVSDYINPNIPVYMSRGAKEFIDITNIFTAKNSGNINASIIRHLRAFEVGSFKVTPYLVDHFAFDALAFLVEADGERVFYSGDFRGSVRGSILFDRIIKDPPTDVDCLLVEGAMPTVGENTRADEDSVRRRIEKILKDSDSITFLFASSRNIDSLVSAYKACLKTDSIFVIDIRTAFILDKLRKVSKNIPQFDLKNMRVKFTKDQAEALVRAGYRALLYAYDKRKIDMFEVNRKKEKILMLAGDNSMFSSMLKDIDKPAGAKIIYSTREECLTDKFREYCDRKGLVIEYACTSARAAVDDIKDFTDAMRAKKVIYTNTFER